MPTPNALLSDLTALLSERAQQLEAVRVAVLRNHEEIRREILDLVPDEPETEPPL